MRVTNLYSLQRQADQILASEERLDEARNRVTTGKKLEKPSDSPAGMARYLALQSRAAHVTARKDAMAQALPAMTASEAALGDITTALGQVRTLALKAANGTTGDADREALANSVATLRDRIVQAANTTSNGRYIFSGTATATRAFEAGLPVAYAGGTDPLRIEPSDGSAFATSITGNQIVGTPGGGDLFANLRSLEDAIRTGDAAGISTGIDAVGADYDRVLGLRADMGARIQYVKYVTGKVTDELASLQQQQSDLSDVDLAGAVIEERAAENAQQAALAMAGRLGNQSLLDYLR